MADSLGDEGSGAAGRVEDALVERVGNELLHHGASQPVGGVVLAEGAAFFGRDDSFVEDGGNVGRSVEPVEAGNAAGQRLDEGVAANLVGPGEEVGLDDAAETGGVVEAATLQQVRGVGFGQLTDVDTEGSLHGNADDQTQVGVADKQPVQSGLIVGDFAEGGTKQVVPEAAFDLDGFGVGVLTVKGGQGVDVALIGGAFGAKVLLHRVTGRGDAFQGQQRGVAEPLIKSQPTVRRFQNKSVRSDGFHRAGVRPTEEPIPAVGEDPGADAFAAHLGLLEVVVNLIDVCRVGIETAHGADALFELDEGVQGGEVDGTTRCIGRRVFLDDGTGFGQVGKDQEIADGAGYVGLCAGCVMSEQDFAGRAGVPGIVDVEVCGHGGIVAFGRFAAGGRGLHPSTCSGRAGGSPSPPAPLPAGEGEGGWRVC